MASPSAQPTVHSTAEMLWQIAQQVGTACYAYDINRLRRQAERLREALPDEVEIYYSLKANASLGISEVFRQCGLGADVASAGELATANEAGFNAERIFVAGPYKSREVLDWLQQHPQAIVSVDSPHELEQLVHRRLTNRAVLRMRPDFRSSAVVAAGMGTRFGFLLEQLPGCRALIESGPLEVIGFHVFAGSQVLHAEAEVTHLQASLDLADRAGDLLGIRPEFLNLGGGFGIAYGQDEPGLDLGQVSKELRRMLERVKPARLALELGRYLVAPAGWYLTRVVGYQTHGGRRAVVVDGGTHQRADLCGLCLRTKAAPPLVLRPSPDSSTPEMIKDGSLIPTDVLGCLSLPEDILAEACLLPELVPGDVLAFGNSGAYGLWASAVNFHGYPLPAEVAFDESKVYLMRHAQPARSILADQQHLMT